jgi:hypothetical protein
MIALCALVLIPLISGAQDRHALVIGNGKYTSVDPLPNPANDVELVADALEKVGFKVTLLKNADRRTMDRAAKKFATELDDAGRNTVGVFYFAGHGVSYEGENWLLPVGVDITQGADIEYETISANKILNLMEGARNATDIIILDACRNSPFRGFSLSGTRAVTRGMTKMDAPKGSYIAYSTAPGAVAYDGDGNYSPFAEALASEIATPGITIDVMMINVRNKVEQTTGRLGQEPQTPWSASSMRDTFAFNPGEQSGSAVPSPDPSPPPRTQQRPQQSGEVADTRFWTSIENSTDPAEFEIYLKRYPDGQYVELARIRKERFSKKPEAKPEAKAVAKNQPSSGTPYPAGGGPVQAAGERSAATNNDDDAARLCRQFAGGDPEVFAECMDEYEGFDGGVWMPDDSLPDYGNLPPSAVPPQQSGQSAIWYDDEFNQWQVSISGANFSASAFLPNSGQVVLRGQTQGFAVSYGIFDTIGQQIGYGQGNIDDASHISVTSYWSNGAILGTGRFHINHPPN